MYQSFFKSLLVSSLLLTTPHAIAATNNDNYLMCWGEGSDGQLGNGKSYAYSVPSFVKISRSNPMPITHISEVTLGEKHSCALLDSGRVKCWGSDSYYKLSNEEGDSYYATDVFIEKLGDSEILTDVAHISAGNNHTCALLKNQQVVCWGSGSDGQLGIGRYSSESRASKPVVSNDNDKTPLSNVIKVVAGGEHSCALLKSSRVKCWGKNTSGQLGNDSTESRYAPVGVYKNNTDFSLLAGVTDIAAGVNHTCALLQNGQVKCWGDNEQLQLGNNSISANASAVPVTVYLDNEGTQALSNVTAITAGDNHTCALLESGQMKCWGYNYYGQLGSDATHANRALPHTVQTSKTDTSPLSNITAIFGGASHSCAQLNNGDIACWGRNRKGQLGNGDFGDDYHMQYTPTVVESHGSAKQLALTSRGHNTCAIFTFNDQTWLQNHLND